MRKCDWCRNDQECRGVERSECIVREYRNFAPYENNGTCRGDREKMNSYEMAIELNTKITMYLKMVRATPVWERVPAISDSELDAMLNISQ